MSDRLQVKVLEDAPFKPPELKPAKEGDVGLDLVACIAEDSVTIPSRGYINIPTGISIKLPWGCWASIRSRSSTFVRRKLLVHDGVIDNNYVGPLLVIVYNPNNWDVVVNKGERLAQLIVHQMVPYRIEYVDRLPETERGSRGLGSTGD